MRASFVTRVGTLLAAAAVLIAQPLALSAQEAIGPMAPPPSGARSKGLRPPQVVISPKAHARAAQITDEAQAHYDAGRFAEATEAYRRAYAVVPAPELLFNLGQCQRQLGRPQRSVRYFEAYLRLRPDAPHRPLVEQLIEEGKLITPPPQTAQEDTQPPAISATSPQAAPPPVRDVKVMPLPPPHPLPASEPTRLLADSRFTEQDSPAVYERWWFWTAIAVVATGAAITTYAVVEANQDSPESGTTLGTIAWD
jgi:tetratricopeptide (TPR) repeat protein